MDSSERKPVPPYVAYKTLTNFLDKFKQGVPGRIDRGLMGSMSGAAQSQVTTAMKYLGMMSDNSIPTPLMKQYVSGEESQRKSALRDMLSASYPFIFDGEFDLSSATAGMLRDAFVQNTTASGETVGRCLAFLKDAAQDADIIVSPYILQKMARSPAAKKRALAVRREEPKSPDVPKVKDDHLPPPVSPQQLTVAAQGSMLLWGLIQKLPKPGTRWPEADKDRWLQTLNHVLTLEYPAPEE